LERITTPAEAVKVTCFLDELSQLRCLHCASVLIFIMDATIVTVALLAIQTDRHARLARLQWILDASTLAVANFLT
jgi:hypothetical protein